MEIWVKCPANLCGTKSVCSLYIKQKEKFKILARIVFEANKMGAIAMIISKSV